MSNEEEIAALRRRLAELEAAQAKTESQATAPGTQPSAPAAPVQQPSNSGRMIGIGILVALVAVFVIAQLSAKSPTKAPSPDPAAPVGNYVAAESYTPGKVVTPAPQNWSYTDSVDPMNDKHTRTACVESNDMVLLESPYEPVTAQLCIRNSAKFGLDAYFALNGSGQILCDSYYGCKGHIRIDEGPRTAVSMSEPADHSSDMLFFSSGKGLLNMVSNSKRARVELTYYQAGSQSVEFNTSGLDKSRLGLAEGTK